MGHRLAICCAVLLVGASYSHGSEQAIEHFHAKLIEAMQTETFAAREELLREPVAELFDFERIARVSLGRTWRELGDADQSAFRTLLEELVVATYASRFSRFAGQTFETVGIRDVSRGSVVQSRLSRLDADDVSLDYFFRDSKVFNVVADGVSDLSLRRADYNSIVKQEGFASLIRHIEEKVREAREEP